MEHFILNQAVTCTANNCPSGHFSLPATEDVIFNSLLLNNNFCSTVSLSERKKKKQKKNCCLKLLKMRLTTVEFVGWKTTNRKAKRGYRARQSCRGDG